MSAPSVRALVIVLVCILAVTFLQAVALWNGINGTALASSVGAIAALGGFYFRSITKLKKRSED